MKKILPSLIVGIAIVVGAILISGNGKEDPISASKTNNVSIVDGKQIVEIDARGGYNPRQSFAKAGIPTVVRFNTKNTFDCSSYVRIPSLNISRTLEQTGSTDIEIGSWGVQTLKGSCGMGMYPFEIEFVE